VHLPAFIVACTVSVSACAESPRSVGAGEAQATQERQSLAVDTAPDAPLCPVLKEEAKGGVLLPESELSAENYEASIVYFEQELPRTLNDSLFRSGSYNETEFWMGYSYSVAYLRGHDLRRAAIRERASRWPDSVALGDTLSKRYRLCEFLRVTRLPD
jgi:hypothetical protein